MGDTDSTSAERRRIREALSKLAAERGASKTFCPSEAARLAFPDGWREHMSAVRDVARHLAYEGVLDVMQRGRTIPFDRPWRSPVRLRQAGATTLDAGATGKKHAASSDTSRATNTSRATDE